MKTRKVLGVHFKIDEKFEKVRDSKVNTQEERPNLFKRLKMAWDILWK